MFLPTCIYPNRIQKTNDVYINIVPYVKEFRYRFNVSTKKINIYLVENMADFYDDDTVGHCNNLSINGTGTINISKTAWDNYGDEKRRLLIFHELAHCSVGIKHDNSYLDNGCKNSIMHHNIDEHCFTESNKYKEYYYKELRDKIRRNK